MGCDIHLFVEKRDADDYWVSWVSADKWETQTLESGFVRSWLPYKNSFYSGRNYELFAMLADVRNGDKETGEDYIKPISEPRGAPDDMSEEVATQIREYGDDGHSLSYLTVQELLAYDWTQTVRSMGIMDFETWAYWHSYAKDQGIRPKEYCKGIGGGKVKLITPEEAKTLFTKIKEKQLDYRQEQELIKETSQGDVHYYVKDTWNQPYYRAASDFLSEVMPKLWKLGHPLDVRIVFFFDN